MMTSARPSWNTGSRPGDSNISNAADECKLDNILNIGQKRQTCFFINNGAKTFAGLFELDLSWEK